MVPRRFLVEIVIFVDSKIEKLAKSQELNVSDSSGLGTSQAI